MSTVTYGEAVTANAYTHVDGWTREHPWQAEGAHFVAIYLRTAHSEHRVRVFVRRDYFKDCTAAVFEITTQLQKAIRLKRRRSHPKRRRA